MKALNTIFTRRQGCHLLRWKPCIVVEQKAPCPNYMGQHRKRRTVSGITGCQGPQYHIRGLYSIMGLGDEIMALGRAECFYEQTGKPCTIYDAHGSPPLASSMRWQPRRGACRWGKADRRTRRAALYKTLGRTRIIFNHEYRARAGKIHLTENQKARWFPCHPALPW